MTARRKAKPKPLVKTAKLFMNGGSQAVRLPKEFAFEGTEVLVSREGDRVLIQAKVAKSKVRTLGDLIRHMAKLYPEPCELVRPPQPPMPPAPSLDD
jgi:virulence-associated protein VagC